MRPTAVTVVASRIAAARSSNVIVCCARRPGSATTSISRTSLPSTSTRPTPGTRGAGEDGDGFLDGRRHAEPLLAGAERSPGRDDRHACGVELGIGGGGENRGGPDARDAKQRHEQIDEAALAAQRVEQRHRGPGAARRILVPSATPYAPFVTTTSPAWSPNVISATVSLRPPTVTDRTWAICSESTTKT